MYSFVSNCMFPKLANVVATGRMDFMLEMVMSVMIDLSCRSRRRLEMTKTIRKITTFVIRDLLAASLYFSFISSASLDVNSFSFGCDSSRFCGS